MSGKSVSFIVCGLLAVSLAAVGCGGSSGGTRPGGTGGSGNVDAAVGIGGSGSGLGGSTAGTGGATTSSQLNCNPGVSPATPLLTGFTSGTDWSSTTGKWGVAGNLQGSIYAYQGPMTGTSAWKAGVDTTAGTLDLGIANGAAIAGGNVAAGDYAGGGVEFSQCVNTTAYTGVSFTLAGTAGGCDVYFQVKTFDEQGISNGGGCDSSDGGSCYSFPQLKIAINSDPTVPIVVHFADVTGGMPTGASAIAAEIVGFQWQLQSSTPPPDASQTGCTGAELMIDNITLVP